MDMLCVLQTKPVVVSPVRQPVKPAARTGVKTYSKPVIRAPPAANTLKDKQMKQEVKKAVRDYLNGLIAERSDPGQGHKMAVTANDLLVATNNVGYKRKYDTKKTR